MAGPTFQALGTAVNVAGTGTLQVDWPTHVTDDIALILIEDNGNTPTSADWKGFTELSFSPLVPDSTTNLRARWCRATSNAMVGPLLDDEAAGNHKICRIITFRGCKTSGAPYSVVSSSTLASTSTVVSIPGATTTSVDNLIVAVVGWATDTATPQASGWTNADLGSVTEIDDVGTTTANGGGFSVATGTKAVAGAYGATTSTLATTSVQSLFTIALEPPSTSVSATADLNLGGITFAAAGTEMIGATAALSLGGMTFAAAGTLQNTGQADLSLGGFTFAAVSTIRVPVTTTTTESLRDYIIATIAALTPKSLVGDRFRKHRNEGSGQFRAHCKANPASAFRRFQVRDTGSYATATVSNTELEERHVEFVTTVAYPQTNRTGRGAALDRDDAMRQDQRKIERAIGLLAWLSFADPDPVATWVGGSTTRERGQGVDYLVIRQTMRFYVAT